MTKVTKSEAREMAAERAILQATELVVVAMQRTGTTRRELAKRLSITPSEVTQRLQGTRNLTLRSVAAMLEALDHHLELSASWDGAHSELATPADR